MERCAPRVDYKKKKKMEWTGKENTEKSESMKKYQSV